MLLHDANDTWADYKEYIVSLFLNNFISDKDYDLSLEHGKLFKDGKPYTYYINENISFDELHDIKWKPSLGNLTCEQRPYGFKLNQKSKTMESVNVTPPEGYEIDPKSTTNEIFFRKKKNDRPSKWIELHGSIGWMFTSYGSIIKHEYTTKDGGKNLWPTKELAEAALALSELMQYRQRWIGDWKSDWCNSDPKYCLIFKRDLLDYECLRKTSHPLSFPTREMMLDFTTTFRNLLETAKPLL